MVNEMTEERLKELAMWARQAAEDGQGNIRKLGESLLEVIAEVRRLRMRAWNLVGAAVVSNDGFSASIDSSAAPRHRLRFPQDPHLSLADMSTIHKLVGSHLGRSLKAPLQTPPNPVVGYVELVFEEKEDE
jgi:hypothetical protein